MGAAGRGPRGRGGAGRRESRCSGGHVAGHGAGRRAVGGGGAPAGGALRGSPDPVNLFARTFVSRVRHPDRFAARAGPERRKVRPRSSGQTLMMRADPRCLPTRAAETAGVLAGNRQGAPGRSSGGMGHAHPSRRPARGCAARVRAGGTPVYGRPRAAASWLRPVKKTAIPAMADRVPMRTAAARHKPSAPGSRTRRESPMKSGSPRSSVMERRSCCAVRPESGGDAPPGCPPRYGSLRDRPRPHVRCARRKPASADRVPRDARAVWSVGGGEPTLVPGPRR